MSFNGYYKFNFHIEERGKMVVTIHATRAEFNSCYVRAIKLVGKETNIYKFHLINYSYHDTGFEDD